MQISNKYIVVEKIEEDQKEGFKTVEVQDSFVYKGKVINKPSMPIYLTDTELKVGDVVLFAKYSPDTHEIDLEGKKVKFVAIADLLAVL